MKMFLAGFLWNHWFWVTVLIFTDFGGICNCESLQTENTSNFEEAWSDPTVIHLNYSQSDTSKPPGQPETLPSGGYTATLPGNGHTATLPGNSHGSRKPLPNVQTGEHLDAEKSVVVSSNQRNGSNIQNSTRYLDETPNMKIGTNAENLTVIENLRAVLEKSADEINDNHDKEMVEASGSGDGELDSSERKSKSIDQLSIVIVKPEEISFLFPSARKIQQRPTYSDHPELPKPMVSGSFTPRWYYNPTHKASGRITTPTTTTGHTKSRVVAERIFTEEEARQIGNDKLATIERRIETAEISSMRNIVHTINASEELFVDNSKQLINDEFIPLSESSNHDYLSEKESINETQENFGSLEFIDSYQQEYNKNLEHYDLEYESSSERSNSASAVGVSMSTLGLLFADSDLEHVTERSRYNNDHHTISTIPTIHKRNGNNNVPHISHDDSDNNHSIQREESHADVNIKEEGENSEIDLANSTVNINDNHNEVKSDSKSELENVPPSESDSTEQLDSDRDSTDIEQVKNDSNDDIDHKNKSENNAKTNNEDFSEFTENISGTNNNDSGEEIEKTERLVENIDYEVWNQTRPEQDQNRPEQGRSLGLEMARSARLPNQFLKQVHEEEEASLSSGGHISLQVKRSTFFLDVSSVVGIAMGLVSFLILITGIAGAFIYRKHIKAKNQGERFSNFDSSSMADSDTFNSISYADCAGIDVHRDNSSEELYSLDNDSFLNSLEAMTFPENWTTKHTNL